jgi:acyl transferase domain-containing protein
MHVHHVIAEVMPWQVGKLQMHGTGTALGDPIEINAALACLMPSAKPHRATRGQAPSPLVLSAAKSAAGHAEAAAGIVGVACAALALETQMSPALLHLRRVTYVRST